MITGFNTNVRYRGRVFHVQTEDSGAKNPHIISHLYYGGTILASEKRRYEEHLGSSQLEDEVRALMEAQHKAMLRRLKGAEFDAVIAERLDGGSETTEPNDDTDGELGSDTSPSLDDVAPPVAEPAASQAPAEGRGFGDHLVSEKPLDEVILDYLVQKARDRAPRAKASRSKARSRSPAKG